MIHLYSTKTNLLHANANYYKFMCNEKYTEVTRQYSIMTKGIDLMNVTLCISALVIVVFVYFVPGYQHFDET